MILTSRTRNVQSRNMVSIKYIILKKHPATTLPVHILFPSILCDPHYIDSPGIRSCSLCQRGTNVTHRLLSVAWRHERQGMKCGKLWESEIQIKYVLRGLLIIRANIISFFEPWNSPRWCANLKHMCEESNRNVQCHNAIIRLQYKW